MSGHRGLMCVLSRVLSLSRDASESENMLEEKSKGEEKKNMI